MWLNLHSWSTMFSTTDDSLLLNEFSDATRFDSNPENKSDDNVQPTTKSGPLLETSSIPMVQMRNDYRQMIEKLVRNVSRSSIVNSLTSLSLLLSRFRSLSQFRSFSQFYLFLFPDSGSKIPCTWSFISRTTGFTYVAFQFHTLDSSVKWNSLLQLLKHLNLSNGELVTGFN